MIQLKKTKQGRLNVYYWDNSPGILYASEGEAYIHLYFLELLKADYIAEIELQPKQLIITPPIKRSVINNLKTKSKIIPEHVASDLKYTADMRIKWTQKAFDDNIVIDFFGDKKKEAHHFLSDDFVTFIECKPDTSKCKPAPDENMTRLFITKQKMIFHELGIWINLIHTNKLFRDTFTLERYIYTAKGKMVRKIPYATRTLEEYIERIKPPATLGLL